VILRLPFLSPRNKEIRLGHLFNGNHIEWVMENKYNEMGVGKETLFTFLACRLFNILKDDWFVEVKFIFIWKIFFFTFFFVQLSPCVARGPFNRALNFTYLPLNCGLIENVVALAKFTLVSVSLSTREFQRENEKETLTMCPN